MVIADDDVSRVDAGTDANFPAARKRVNSFLNGVEITKAVDAVADRTGATTLQPGEWRKFLAAIVDHLAARAGRPLDDGQRGIPPPDTIGSAAGFEQPRHHQIWRFGPRRDNPIIVGMVIVAAESYAQAGISERNGGEINEGNGQLRRHV